MNGKRQTIFTILGTSAGPGVPSFFCDCPACREADADPSLARTRTGAAIATEDGATLLIDTCPDLRRQLRREGIAEIDRVFLTHWHYDHFGGIGELEYYIRLQRGEAIELALPPSAEGQFAAAFPYLQDCLSCVPWAFGAAWRRGGLAVTPLEADHGCETAGFLVETTNRRLAYFPDAARLPAATRERVAGVDWLVCDATFHDENLFPDQHMSFEQAIALGQEVAARHTVLTHLAIHYRSPVTADELQSRIAGHPQVSIAHDGMRFCL